MKLSQFLFAFATFAALSKAQNALDAVLLDYKTQEFMVAFSGTTAPTNVYYQVTQGSTVTVAWKPTATVPTCVVDGRRCTFTVSELAESRYRAGTVSVAVSFDSGGAGAMSTGYVGRNLVLHNVVYSLGSINQAVNLEASFGVGADVVEEIGYDYPLGVQFFNRTDGVLSFLKLNYALAGLSPSFGQNPNNTANADSATPGAQSFSERVTKLTVYSNDAPNSHGGVCGIAFSFTTAADISYGCTTHAEEFNFAADGTQFAGFYALNNGVDTGDFVLYPLSYELLAPRLIHYTPTDTGLDITIQSYWPIVYQWAYKKRDQLSATGEVSFSAEVTGSVDNSGASGAQSNVLTITDIPPCVPLNFSFAISNTEGRHYSYWDEFTAWTLGWVASSTETVDISSASGTSYSSQHVYYDSIPDGGQCPVPRVFSVAAGNGKLWVNGEWLGPTEATPTSITTIADTNKIDTVIVYYDDTGSPALRGIEFKQGSNNLGSSGVTTGHQQITTFSKSGEYLMYIEAVHSGSVTAKLNFVFSKPRGPGMFVAADVTDTSNTFVDARFTAEKDADLQRIYWYNSADYDTLEVKMRGFFMAMDTEQLSATTTQTMSRASVSTAVVTHLVAGREYYYELMGSTTAFGDSKVEPSTTNFTVPNGVQIMCTDAGLMTMQIEYEAVPDVSVTLMDTAYKIVNDLSSITPANVSSDSAENLFTPDAYFQYNPNPDNYPKNPAFFGYPTRVEAYWDNQAASSGTADTCIRGLIFTYRNLEVGTNKLHLGGSEADYATLGTANDRGTSFVDLSSKTDGRITGVNYRDNGVNCISDISFAVADGTTDCIGINAAGCSSAAFTQPQADYYLLSLGVTINSANNRYIYGFYGTYSNIDFPTLVATERSCHLPANVNHFYIRQSSWHLVYDLAANASHCGTSMQIFNRATTPSPPVPNIFYNHEVVYHQLIRRNRDDPATQTFTGKNGLQISRLNAFEVSGYCYYNAEGAVSAQFRTHSEEPYKVVGVQQLHFTMAIFTDNTYTREYASGSTPTMLIGDYVYARVTIVNVYDTYKMAALACWATKDNNPDNPAYWPLQNNTCKEDLTFERVTAASNNFNDAFRFKAFSWFEGGTSQSSTIFLHCKARACPDTGTSACNVTDPAQCPTPSTPRRRREAGTGLSAAGADNEVQLVSRGEPLIFVPKAASEILEVYRDPIETKAPVDSQLSGLFLLVMFFCAVAAGMRVRNLRRSYVLHRTR